MICIDLWDNKKYFIDPNKKGKEIQNIKQLMNSETYFSLIKKQIESLEGDEKGISGNYMDLLYFIQNNALITQKEAKF